MTDAGAWQSASPWPEPDELLLLRAALLDGNDALDAWRAFTAAHGGIEDLGYASYRLLPRLSRTLAVLDPHDPETARLKGVYRHAWYANQQLLYDGSVAIGALQESGIPVIVLKGAALIALYPDNIGLRPMDDVDILVRPRDAERALAVLHALGWTSDERRSLIQVMRLRHALALRGPRGELDLHWSSLAPRSDDEQLWEDAIPVSLHGVRTSAPSPTDQLLLACAHGLGWSPSRVRWITDAMLVIGTTGEEIDWPGLVERARLRRITLDLAAALDFLKTEFAVAVPASVVAELRRSPVRAGERVAHAIKVAPRRRGAHWRLARVTARRSDLARRLAAAPPTPSGHPVGALSYLQEEWNMPSRRAVVIRAIRTGVGFLGPGAA
jgi:hypothetical protein